MASERVNKTDDEKNDKVDDPLKKKEGVDQQGKISPYYLSNSDNPGNIITQVQLKGDNNYDEWARAVKTALRAKKKFGFVDGSLTQPSDDSEDLEDWWTVNSMLVSWILNTIEPTVRSTISYMEVAKHLWDDIKERFSVGNGPRIQQLKSELADCKQRGMTILNYYGKLKMIWEELRNYEQYPSCKCSGCRCNIGAELDKKREEEKLHQFLMGLDDSTYGAVRTNILSTEPLPTLNKAYALVIQAERVRTITRTKEEKGEQVAFAVRVGKGRVESKDKDEECSNCSKTGHAADSCFELIGYPEWWGDRGRTSGRGAGRGRGGQRGAITGGRGRGGRIKANAVQIGSTSKVEQTVDADNGGLHGLSSEQWNTLLNLLSSQKEGSQGRLSGKHKIIEWIIDTGASHHMTGSFESMSDVKGIMPCFVGLPNGKNAVAEKEGTVVLDGHLKLTNVLYVPDLNCNLISVSQLTEESNCFVQFTNKFCVIQDHTSRMLIGAGEQREGLYYFCGVPLSRALKVVENETMSLWHQRLGHPSHKVVTMLPFASIRGKEIKCIKDCDVCFRAKQCREEFILSNNKASDIFELIHCDLWGPYRTAALCGAHYFLTIVDDFSRGVWIYLLNDKTEPPSYANVRVFGCLSYAHNRGHGGDKFASRSKRSIFVGYPYGKKGWRMYDLESGKIFVSRDVTFIEHEFPYVGKEATGNGKEGDVVFNDTGVEDEIIESCVSRPSVLNRKTSDEIEHGELHGEI
ncbi:unnamed protein product [Trifolium pratense]|uniref:Uncharacterized protein n=1 Tax=Trifolium pratense TaxID=57577 RepID=A0ACB0IJT9_TRIPR|nr:unnamed protein product [Trifolium pratense]